MVRFTAGGGAAPSQDVGDRSDSRHPAPLTSEAGERSSGAATHTAALPQLADRSLESEAWQRLIEVYDPELGIDVVNLGLVYGLRAEDGVLRVAMTLTTPGCPMGGSIPDQVRFVLDTIPGVRGTEIDLVWEPPWEPEMMSAAARQALGWL